MMYILDIYIYRSIRVHNVEVSLSLSRHVMYVVKLRRVQPFVPVTGPRIFYLLTTLGHIDGQSRYEWNMATSATNKESLAFSN